MRPDEVRALAEIAGDAVSGLTQGAREMHGAIAARVFAFAGPGGLPVRFVHDKISQSIYTSVEGGLRTLVGVGAKAVSARVSPDAPSLEQSTAGRIAVGALNGALGDTLARRHNPLAVRMSIRRAAADVPPTQDALRAAFPAATDRLAVFVHGVGQTDDAWLLGGERHVPYGYRLHAELGYTPLFIRYNSGRHVSDSGAELAELLERVAANWPVSVREIALIGHSMGGLVARSACHYGSGREWVKSVRHVFTLATPHSGLRLEQLANATSSALALVPETRTFAKALNARSDGIKDLRFGYVVEDDWRDENCDAFLRNTAREVPFLRTANHYFISASVTPQSEAPVGRMLGDLLVLRASAWSHRGPGERLRFPVDHYRHIGGMSHFDLLNHPAIYDQLRRWLTSRRALPAPRRLLAAPGRP